MLERFECARMAKRGLPFLGLMQNHCGMVNSLMTFGRTVHTIGMKRNRFLMKDPQAIGCRSLTSRELITLFYKRLQQNRNGARVGEQKDCSNLFGSAEFLSKFLYGDSLPHVPLVAVRHGPLFPGFMKIFELTHPSITAVVRNRVRIKLPYVGLFLKKNDDPHDTVESLDDIHKVGVFGHIHEMWDTGDHIRILVVAHFRIRIKRDLSVQTSLIDDEDKSYKDSLQSLCRSTSYPHMWNIDLLAQLAGFKSQRQRELDFLPDIAYGSGVTHIYPVLLVDVGNYLHFRYKLSKEIEKMMRHIVRSLLELSTINTLIGVTIKCILEQDHLIVNNAVSLCDLTATLSSGEPKILQAMLEEVHVEKLLELAMDLVDKEVQLARLQENMLPEDECQERKKRRLFFLKKEMRLIENELRILNDDKDALINQYRIGLQGKNIPEHIESVIDEEMQKLVVLDNRSIEFNMACNYLDWLVSLPWGMNTVDFLNIEEANSILEKDLYGIEDVKSRILEFVAVSFRKGNTQGRVLCFHGPPGIGKTTVARCVARALNRHIYQFNVGGISDVAKIKGQHRTYIGAMPGKPIQILKILQVENPLILVNDVDKMGDRSCSALLELMDIEKNPNFQDFYLDVPVDFSRVLFICTANLVESIPEPLRERMQLIEMSGYIAEEKIAIARKYLIPAVLEACGFIDDRILITDDAIEALIRGYCREAGVRGLQKFIGMIIRKIAFNNPPSECVNNIVDGSNLKEYAGEKLYNFDRMYRVPPPGVAMGLALTAAGGRVIPIETAKRVTSDISSNGSGSIQLTRNVGKVMEESAEIALTVARNFLHENYPEKMFLDHEEIHMHIPEGASPMDGPGAGVTLVTALLSLALNISVKPLIAMAGKVSLKGKILQVHGIREKIIAAKNCGVQILILPAQNKTEFFELPNYITSGLKVHFVEDYRDVFPICFGKMSLPKETKVAIKPNILA